MSNPFKTKQFKDLEKEWYGRLTKSGFKDIERRDRIGKAAGRMKTGTLDNIIHSYDEHQFSVKEEYYRVAGQFLHSYKFKSALEKSIWSMHSEGLSIRNIIKSLKAKGHTAYRDLVNGAIKRLALEMKVYASKK